MVKKLTSLWYKIRLIALILKSKRVILLTQNKEQIENDTHRNVAVGFTHFEQITTLLYASYYSINEQEDALEEARNILKN